jgi:Ni/Fe-hydrogenase subunit HybB-like protein
LEALTAILTGLGILLAASQHNNAQANQQRDLAITAVMAALSETLVYLNAYGRTVAPSRLLWKIEKRNLWLSS